MITDNKVVLMDYTLKNAQGEVVDSSEGREPMPYLHGADNIVVGLEKALAGKKTGDHVEVEVSAEEGYGSYDEAMVETVPKEMFGENEVEVGMTFHAQTEQAGVSSIVIKAIDGDQITIDGNHPLAGQALFFSVDIVEVRDATEDELEHGHVHSGSCNH